MALQEQYTPVVMTANSTYTFPSGATTSLGGFLCITAGTFSAYKSSGAVIISGLPVSAGVYYPMPFRLGHDSYITLGGNASGVLGVF